MLIAKKNSFISNKRWFEFLPLVLGSYLINYSFVFYFFKYRVLAFRSQPSFFYLYVFHAFTALFLSIILIEAPNNSLSSQLFSFFSYISFSIVLIFRLSFTIKDVFDGLVISSFIYSFAAVVIFFIVPEFNFIDVAYTKIAMRKYIPAWPQRFPQMIVLAALYLLIKEKKTKFELLCLILFYFCVAITFTRSLYISLLIPTMIIIVKKYSKSLGYFFLNFRFKPTSLIIFVGNLFLIYFLILSENPIKSLLVNLVKLLNSYDVFGDQNISLLGASEQERVLRFYQTINIFLQYPIFGSGFKGIYQFSDLGSTHNQYTDILLRTGITGIIIQGYLVYYIYVSYKNDYDFIVPVIFAILLFSFFNESVKLPFMGYLIFILNNKCVIKNSLEGKT